jgi:hypothetical protein
MKPLSLREGLIEFYEKKKDPITFDYNFEIKSIGVFHVKKEKYIFIIDSNDEKYIFVVVPSNKTYIFKYEKIVLVGAPYEIKLLRNFKDSFTFDLNKTEKEKPFFILNNNKKFNKVLNKQRYKHYNKRKFGRKNKF